MIRTKSKARRSLERAIRRHVVAEIMESWKGGGDPDDWDAISAHRRKMRRALTRKLDELLPKTEG